MSIVSFAWPRVAPASLGSARVICRIFFGLLIGCGGAAGERDGGPGAEDAGEDAGRDTGAPVARDGGAPDAGDETLSGGTPALGWEALDGDLAPGSRLRIRTDGTFDFGVKERAAPVLVDYVSHAWVNGVLDEHQRGFADMQPIRRPDEDPDTLWAKPTVVTSDDDVNSGMLYTTSRPHRYPESEAHYYAVGNNNFLGWPTAYGGTSPDSPSRRIYVSWWCKMPYDLARYHAIPADAAETAFDVGGAESYGEEITISGVEGRGRILGHATGLGDGTVTEGWLFFEPPMGYGSIANLRGQTITGVSSGATVTIPNEASVSKWDYRGYLVPRGKYARIWTEDESFRMAVGNIGVAYTGPGSGWFNETIADREDWDDRLIRPGEWNHWEAELSLDPAAPHLRVSANHTVLYEGGEEFVVGLEESYAEAPTLALLGINDFMPVVFTTEVSDIYMDDGFARVFVGDASEYDRVSHFELQRPVRWESADVEVVLHYGALAGDRWLYVIGPDGEPVSRSGVPLTE